MSKPSKQKIIKSLLESSFNIHLLEITNESYMHNVPKDSETHFKVIISSAEFESKRLLVRHRLVNNLLAEELKSTVHALSIVAKTPTEWEKKPVISSSPACLGGSKGGMGFEQ